MAPHCHTRSLLQPLGPWQQEDDRDWNWWRLDSTDCLYQQTKEGWQRWTRKPTGGSVAKYHLPHPVEQVPSNKIRVSIHAYPRHNIVSVASSGLVAPPSAAATPTTLAAQVQTLPHDAQWSIQSLDHPDEGATVAPSSE